VMNSKGEMIPAKLCANEDHVLAKESLKHGDTLVIEEGCPPPAGQIVLKLYLSQEHLSSGEGTHSSGEGMHSSGEGMHSSGEGPPSSTVEFFGEISTSEKVSLLKLKELLLENVEFSALTLGRCEGDARRLRVQHVDHDGTLGGVYREHRCTLKVLEVYDGASLAVKVLQSPEDLGSNSTVIRVQRRIPNEFNYEAPIEIVVDAGGQALSSAVLATHLGKLYSIPAEHLAMALRVVEEDPAASPWKLLRKLEPAQGQSQSKKKSNRKKRAPDASGDDVIPNLLRAPWNLKDMDLVAVKDRSLEEDLVALDDFSSTEDLERGTLRYKNVHKGARKDAEEVALSITMMCMRD